MRKMEENESGLEPNKTGEAEIHVPAEIGKEIRKLRHLHQIRHSQPQE